MVSYSARRGPGHLSPPAVAPEPPTTGPEHRSHRTKRSWGSRVPLCVAAAVVCAALLVPVQVPTARAAALEQMLELLERKGVLSPQETRHLKDAAREDREQRLSRERELRTWEEELSRRERELDSREKRPGPGQAPREPGDGEALSEPQVPDSPTTADNAAPPPPRRENPPHRRSAADRLPQVSL